VLTPPITAVVVTIAIRPPLFLASILKLLNAGTLQRSRDGDENQKQSTHKQTLKKIHLPNFFSF
jgi:hypothetical protein